ncbi:MAG: sigma-70 family RNA polymerase sigma factor [Phycisphaerae bacterium]|nr:sigma-70 family RNA polymerase sigma factor [Phycisphaerae bacterium]
MITRTSTTLLADLRDPDNSEAWGLFVDQYRPFVIGYARRRGLQPSDAQDVAQEVLVAFLNAHRKGHYSRSRGRFRDWLGGIAAHKLADTLQRLARRELQPIEDSGTAFLERQRAVSPDEHLEAWEREWERFVLNTCMRTVAAEFDAGTLRAFELYALKGEAANQVARSLDVSRNAVYIAKSRVLERMRQIRQELELTEAAPAVH